MISNNVTLGDILNSPNQYIIPVFQRYYRWDQPEWAKLWDSLAGLQRPEKTGRHFMGFLVLVPEPPSPGKLTTYYLIDGQQRLTTLSLILAALRDSARASGLEELADEVANTYLMHPYRKGAERFRVYPKQGDRDPFVAAIKGEPLVEGRIASAVRYFQGRLAAIPDAGTEAGLRAFFDLLSQRLEFVYARLDGENPFNIFKSLNSTGVPLGPADLIRNFLFMQVEVEAQDAFNDELWKPIERRFQDAEGTLDAERFSAFFRDFLMQDGAYVPPDQTFEAFQDRYASTDFDSPKVAAELKRAAEWY